MRKTALYLVPALLAAGVMNAEAKKPKAAWHAPAITIAGMNAATAQSRMAIWCGKVEGSVEVNTERQVVCSKPMDGSLKSSFWKAFFTPRYATNPTMYVRFNFSPLGDSLTIQIDSYLKYQNAYGQETTLVDRNGEWASQLQANLDHLKADWEAGITEPRP